MGVLITESGAPYVGRTIAGKTSTTGGKVWGTRNRGWYRIGSELRPGDYTGSTTAQMWIDTAVADVDVSFDLILPANGSPIDIYLGNGGLPFAVGVKSGSGSGGTWSGAGMPDGQFVVIKSVPGSGPWNSSTLRTSLYSSDWPDNLAPTEHSWVDGIPWVTGDRMRVVGEGQQLKVYRNGSLVMQGGVYAMQAGKTRTVWRASGPNLQVFADDFTSDPSSTWDLWGVTSTPSWASGMVQTRSQDANWDQSIGKSVTANGAIRVEQEIAQTNSIARTFVSGNNPGSYGYVALMEGSTQHLTVHHEAGNFYVIRGTNTVTGLIASGYKAYTTYPVLQQVILEAAIDSTGGYVILDVGGTRVIDVSGVNTRNGGTNGVINQVNFGTPDFTNGGGFYRDNIVISYPGGGSLFGVANIEIATPGNASVAGATATINVSAGAGSTSSGGGSAVSVSGATATANVSAGAGSIVTGGSVLGDFFAEPIILTGISGTLSVNLSGSTFEDEPDDPSKSIWLKYTTATPGQFILRGTSTNSSYILDMLDGITLAEMTTAASASYETGVSSTLAEVDQRISANSTYFRVRNNGGLETSNSVDLQWYFFANSTAPIMDLNTTTLTETPASLAVSLVNLTPGETVTFSISGVGTVLSQPADSAGILTTSVPVPAVAAGTYTLTATAGGGSASATFEVLYSSVTPPPPDPDAPPHIVVQPPGVTKWILQDKAPGGETYVFDLNPARMTSPFAPKMITPETTTAPDGQPVLWQGADRPHLWQFEGKIRLQSQYDAFVRFLELQRKFYLIDHRNRAWVVTFEEFSPEHIGRNNELNNYRYSMSAYVYAGPRTPE